MPESLLLPQDALTLHSPDLGLALVLVQPLIQVIPPLEEHCIAYQLEPWRELQALVFEHSSQILL